MQPEKESHVKAGQHADAAGAGDTPVACPSCRTPLVAGMRFCRMCGYRLGEGLEEYAATRRFSGDIPFAPPPTATASQQQAAGRGFTPGTWAPLAAPGTHAPTFAGAGTESASACSTAWRRLRGNWMVWVVLMIVLMTASGVVLRNVRRGAGFRGAPAAAARASFLGVDGFERAEGGGAFIEGVAAPETPVWRAGLLGGDVITRFDGKEVGDDDDMRRILRETPPGKTVEVVFIRDGETKTTTLTTMAERDYRGLGVLDGRPGGRGQLRISDLDRVRVPNSNIYGVRVGDVERNGPADLAGLREGDIVTDINGHPVRTDGDLRLRIYESVPGSTATVVVVRDGQRVEIPVKVGRSR